MLTLFCYHLCNPMISNHSCLSFSFKIYIVFGFQYLGHFGCSSGCTFSLILPLADVTVLLSLTVFMNLVSAIMPTTSDAVPLIGKRAMTSVHR